MTIGDSLGPDGRRPELYGVEGWLGFLCVTLLLLTPLGLLIEIVSELVNLNRGADPVDTAIGIGAGIAITAFAVFTGLGLLRIRPNALRVAKIYFWVSLGLGLIVILALVFTPGTTMMEGVQTVRWTGGSAAWLAYLYLSRRVRNTYSRARAEELSEAFR